MCRKYRLAAARRNLDADSWHIFHPIRRLVTVVRAQTQPHIALRRYHLVGGFRRLKRAPLEIHLDRRQRVVLIMRQCHAHELTSSSPSRKESGGTRSSTPPMSAPSNDTPRHRRLSFRSHVPPNPPVSPPTSYASAHCRRSRSCP